MVMRIGMGIASRLDDGAGWWVAGKSTGVVARVAGDRDRMRVESELISNG